MGFVLYRPFSMHAISVEMRISLYFPVLLLPLILQFYVAKFALSAFQEMSFDALPGYFT